MNGSVRAWSRPPVYGHKWQFAGEPRRMPIAAARMDGAAFSVAVAEQPGTKPKEGPPASSAHCAAPTVVSGPPRNSRRGLQTYGSRVRAAGRIPSKKNRTRTNA